MSKVGNTYGTRKCLSCQKNFEATRPSQVTCSEKCRLARRKALKNANDRQRRELPWENVEWLNCKLEEAISTHRQNKSDMKKAVPAQSPEMNMQAEKRDAKKSVSEKFRHICATCGSTFKSDYKDDRFCCEQCAKEATIGGIM